MSAGNRTVLVILDSRKAAERRVRDVNEAYALLRSCPAALPQRFSQPFKRLILADPWLEDSAN